MAEPPVLAAIGTARPGLLSEVFAVLHDLRCSTVDTKAWTHGGRIAALVFVRDEETGAPIDDGVREEESRAAAEAPTTTAVAVQEWGERGYSVVTMICRDRPKLLFDVVCTLTDLDYVVYHGTFDTDGDHAQQANCVWAAASTGFVWRAEAARALMARRRKKLPVSPHREIHGFLVRWFTRRLRFSYEKRFLAFFSSFLIK